MPRVAKSRQQKTKRDPAKKTMAGEKTTKRKSTRTAKKTVRATKQKKAKRFDSQLKAIYSRNGKMPDLSKLDKKNNSRLTRFLIYFIIIAVFLSAVAWAGFLFFEPWSSRSSQSLEISIEGPDQVESGSEVEFSIKYKNNGRVPLAALEIQLNLPDTLKDLTKNPKPTQGDNTWTIGSLRPGSDGSIDFSGTIFGDVPSTSTIQAIITYRPANFNADFQDIETKEFEIKTTVFEGKIEGPDKTVPGEKVEYTFMLKNNGKLTQKNILAYIKPPSTFLIEESVPKLEEDQLFWEISTINPGETMELKVEGSYAAEAIGPQEVGFSSVYKSDDGIELIQIDDKIETEVLGGNLALQLIANGSATDQAVDPGDTLRASINFSNAGEEEIGDVSLALKIETPDGLDAPIVWEEANLADGNFDPTTGEITWDYLVLPELALLEPGDEGVIDINLPIMEGLEEHVADKLTLTLVSSLETIGEVESSRTLSTSPINIMINSDFRLVAEARYFDDDGTPLGTGPIPPTVDETTTYRIIWKITNSIHELEKIEVTTTLPIDTTWTGRTATDIGELSFDPESRIVRWYVDSLPVSINEISSTFEIGVTPEESDVGTFMKITNTVSGSADDLSTNSELSSSLERLTSELPNDEYAVGSGVVIEAN